MTSGAEAPEGECKMAATITNLGQAPTCSAGYCQNVSCDQRVAQINGAWFITMNHAGFNSAANNDRGYVSEMSARRASLTIQRKAVR
jgi:hypothetical protein